MHTLLLEHIRQLIPISYEESLLIIEAYKIKTLKKKEMLLDQGDPSNHMRFVVDGCLKVYSLDGESNERILQFGIRGWWINDLYAYLTQSPSTYFIQAITDSVVLQIHRDQLEKLYDKIPMIDRFYRIKTQNAYVALQERTIRAMSEPVEERYNRFVNQYRDMEQMIPQYMIASYLGVTPEHLSAIRKKMSMDSRS